MIDPVAIRATVNGHGYLRPAPAAVSPVNLESTRDVGELHALLASIRCVQGDAAAAVTEADLALRCPTLSAGSATATEAARLLGVMGVGDLPAARRRAEAALAGEEETSADVALPGALAALAVVGWHDARMSHAIALAGAGLRRSERSGVGRDTYVARLVLSLMLAAVGQFETAAGLVEEAGDAIDSLPAPMWSAAPAVFAAHIDLAAGNLSDACSNAMDGAARARDTGAHLLMPTALATMATVALLRADPDAGSLCLDRLRDEPAPGRLLVGEGRLAWLRARVANASGDDETAMAALAGVYASSNDHRRLFMEEPAAGAWCVRFAMSAGDTARAEAVVGCAEQLAAENPEQPTMVAAAQHARGVLRQDVDLLMAASEAHVHPWARASAEEDLGVALLSDGKTDDAHRHLARAGARYGRYGFELDQTRVDRRLRGADGGRRRSRQVHPVIGFGSLTETERRVADHVAMGLTNVEVARQLYMSRHTVDFHLRQIFRKLQVRSRVELTRLLIVGSGVD